MDKQIYAGIAQDFEWWKKYLKWIEPFIEKNPLLSIFLLIVGSALFIYYLYIKHYSPYKIQQNQFEKERYDNAIRQLNDDTLSIKLAGIQELRSILNESKKYKRNILNTLTNYIQIKSPAIKEPGRNINIRNIGKGQKSVNISTTGLPIDKHQFASQQHKVQITPPTQEIQEIINLICTIGKCKELVDLSETNLSGIVFEDGMLNKASFVGSTLRKAIFRKTICENSDFSGTILNDVYFDNCKLRKSKFSLCWAHRANFDKSDIRETDFFAADLYDASIQKTSAHNSQFFSTKLWRLSGGLSDLQGASFQNCDLEGADLHAAINLKLEQIQYCETGGGTRFPWSNDQK